jgi:CRP-like cAMP-binding protein
MSRPTQKELAARLADVPLFNTCSKTDLRIIARHLELLDAAEGTEIVTQGEEGDAFFVLLGGEASVRRNSRIVARLVPGDYFGEISLLSPGPRSASVRADTDVILGGLHARMFNVLLRDTRSMRTRLLEGLAARVRELDRTLAG